MAAALQHIIVRVVLPGAVDPAAALPALTQAVMAALMVPGLPDKGMMAARVVLHGIRAVAAEPVLQAVQIRQTAVTAFCVIF